MRSQRIGAWKYASTQAENKFVIFGAGELGIKTLKSLLSAGLRPLAFIDNNSTLVEGTLENISILHPDIALQRLGPDVLVLLAVYNTYKPRNQLKALGFTRVIHCVNMFAGMPDVALPYVCLDDTDVVFQNVSQVKEAFELMADESSREQYLAQIRYRLFMDFDKVLKPQTSEM